jgi:hypothetical protein
MSVRSIRKLSAGGRIGRNRRLAHVAAAARRGQDRRRRPGVAMPRQDVENDVGGMDAVGEGFGAGRLDSRQAVGQHRRQHLDHLAALAPRPMKPRLAGGEDRIAHEAIGGYRPFTA